MFGSSKVCAVTKHTKLGVESDFFQKPREGSLVKQKIVTDYFIAYNRKLTPGPREKVGYADLFAGPGYYMGDDGIKQRSIPILICEAVIATELFRKKVHLWFNEGDQNYYEQLNTAIDSIPGIETLRYKPKVTNKIIDAAWALKLTKLRVPTLVFLDPCGYKGLSLKLITSVLGGFGNDCIFFFNYSRVNMKLDLEIMNRSLDDFFEPERAETIRANIQHRTPGEREKIIMDVVESAMKEATAIPVSFGFKHENGRRSHYLIFASKNRQAAGMMKRILNSVSSDIIDGVGSGEHDPRAGENSPGFFDGLYEVEQRILTTFAGQEISFGDLLEKEAHTRHTDTNYRDAVLRLEQDKTVIVDPPAEKRSFQKGGEKRTLPKNVLIRFPKGER